MKKGHIDETTFNGILKHLQLAEFELQNLVFSKKDLSATIATDEILHAIKRFENWYMNGGIFTDES